MKKRLKQFSLLLLFIMPNLCLASEGVIPDTGQTTKYSTTFGEDADYTINPPSYTKLDSSGYILPDTATTWAMVKDNITGLIWENKTDDGSIHDKDNTYTWYDPNPAINRGRAGTAGNGNDSKDFIDALNAANFGGHNDWRLPTIKELQSIVVYGRYGPLISTDYFSNAISSHYWFWSSTTYARYFSQAYRINFSDGLIYGSDKSGNCYVRAVRGVQSGGFNDSMISNRLMDNGNGTVTDTYTGLMWQQQGNKESPTWESAISYCENLSLAGYNDWRLPNIKEIYSIADFYRIEPVIDPLFTQTISDHYWLLLNYYWSSTTCIGNSSYAWLVDFSFGNVFWNNGYKNDRHYVRAVRAGQSGRGVQPPTKPVLLLPSNGTTNGSLTPTLTTNPFSDADTGDTHLKTDWQISDMADFSFLVLNKQSTIHLTTLPVPDMVLEEGKTFYWRVRFYDSGSTASEWSDAFSFTTLQTTVDTNANGIPDLLENQTADLNNDGIADIQQPTVIKSLNTLVGGGQMGVSNTGSATGTELVAVNSIDPATISDYARPQSMPLGMLSFRIRVASPGDTVSLTVYFSEPAPQNTAWLYHDPINGWADYTQYVIFSQDRRSAVITLQDGGHGDSDGMANGIISDPSGFGIGSWIKGLVSDIVTRQSISNAAVSVPDLNLTMRSLPDGQYLGMLLPGTYNLAISADGYESGTASNVAISEADIVTQNISLAGRARISGFQATGTPSTSSPVAYSINAKSGSAAIQYRYSIHYGYGTSEYTGQNWQSMTGQSMTGAWFLPDRSCSYTFSSAGKSIVVIWATSSDTANLNPYGIPIMGWSVDTSASDCTTNFTGVTITGDQKVNQPITFAVSSQNSCSKTLYYRFSMHPYYGTSGYDGYQWKSMSSSEWVSSNSVDYTFNQTGKYVIVVWVTDDITNVDSNGIPIIGWSVDIE